MCTVAFLPNNGNFCFASLRDESPKRQLALSPTIYNTGNVSFLAPIDPQAGGTWVGINAFGNVIILLNGGFNNHTRQKQYKKSRGLIVTELLASAMPVFNWELIDFSNIEAFTLIVFNDGNLFQLVWDGHEKHKIWLSITEPHIWSSATLYNAQAKKTRESHFKNWMAITPKISYESVLDFLKSIDDTTNGFIINRSSTMRTLSYTFLEVSKNDVANITYLDLVTQAYTSKKLEVTQTIQA
jgi:hypothetical protein